MMRDDECGSDIQHERGGMFTPNVRGTAMCCSEMGVHLSIHTGSYEISKFFFQWTGTSVGSDADFRSARAAREAAEAFELGILEKHMPMIRAGLLRELVGLQSLLTGQDSFDDDVIAVLRILAEDSGFLSRGIPTP